jgi:hypothetical protein
MTLSNVEGIYALACWRHFTIHLMLTISRLCERLQEFPPVANCRMHVVSGCTPSVNLPLSNSGCFATPHTQHVLHILCPVQHCPTIRRLVAGIRVGSLFRDRGRLVYAVKCLAHRRSCSKAFWRPGKVVM